MFLLHFEPINTQLTSLHGLGSALRRLGAELVFQGCPFGSWARKENPKQSQGFGGGFRGASSEPRRPEARREHGCGEGVRVSNQGSLQKMNRFGR